MITQHNKEARIIFLDIEGVLAGHALNEPIPDLPDPYEIKSYPFVVQTIPSSILETLSQYDLLAVLRFSKKAVQNLKQLCIQHQAQIVISSSWRHEKTLVQLKALFSLQGLSEYVLDVTPSSDSRGKEIQAWLLHKPFPVKSFVILDDHLFDLRAIFKERFVLCDTLFSDESLFEQASHILSIPV